MSLLPQRILPENLPFVRKDGIINHNWWLFLYNLSQQVLGGNLSNIQIEASLDSEIDSTVLPVQGFIPEDLPPLPPQQLVLEADLPDPIPRARPEQNVAPGASPFVYTALADGWMLVSGGTVSAIAVQRSTTFYAVTGEIFPLSRLDQLKITYSSSPALVFFPN